MKIELGTTKGKLTDREKLNVLCKLIEINNDLPAGKSMLIEIDEL